MSLLNQVLQLLFRKHPLFELIALLVVPTKKVSRTKSVCLKTSVKSISGLRGVRRQSKVTRSADISRLLVLLDPHFLQDLHHCKCSLPTATLAWDCPLTQSRSPTLNKQLSWPILCIFWRPIHCSPVLCKSQTFSQQSAPLKTKIVSLWGDHRIWNIHLCVIQRHPI